MTIHEALFSTVRQPLLAVLYLLLTLQMTLFLASCRDGRSGRLRLFLLLHLLLSFACLWFPLMDIDSNHFRTDAPVPLPGARSAFTLLPVWTLFLYETLTALILAAVFWEHIRYRKDHPTVESIKETMDLLPAGIAFGRPDGTVVFRNLTMNRLSRSLIGTNMDDMTAFEKAIFPEAADSTERSAQAALPDGTVWQLTAKDLPVDGATYAQLIATDITEQAAVTRELEKKNEKLRDLHRRLDIYNKQADRIIIAQELLTARMTVHSEVGNVLLESRHYLRDPASFDEEKLLQALKNTNTYLLREYEEDDTARDPLTDAVEKAEAIGVDVVISGPIPAEAPYRPLLAAAINECASNAVKHANGNRLTVRIRKSGKEVVYLLQSNGDLPGEAIRESGGLLYLRSLVEKEGGTMLTERLPEFTLTIRLDDDRLRGVVKKADKNGPFGP